MTVTMVDGINADVPAIHARYPGNPVACYVNGIYAWSPAQEALFARKIRVSVESGQPDAARFARCLDVERGAAVPADAGPFLARRAELGHADGTIYTSAANVGRIPRPGGVPRWWVAWYWGQPTPPTAGQVLAEVRSLTGVEIAPARLWACQWKSTSSWDLSIVYGPQDWSR